MGASLPGSLFSKMGYSPDYLRGRRRALARRRRAIVGLSITLVLAGAGIALYFLNQPHHVVVVRVAGQAHSSPSRSATTTVRGYQAAPGAPSDAKVKAALAATEHKHPSSSGTGGEPGGGTLTGDAEHSFQQLAASVPGGLEIAVQPLGSGARQVLGSDEPAHGWSTTKVPVLVALLRARGAAGLSSEEQAWARSAITESSNESVLSLFGDLERLKGGLTGASAYMESVLQAGGDSETGVPTAPPPAGAVTTFGQTEWSPGEAVKFFRALAVGCLLPPDQTSYVLELMESIVSSESWGLGSAGFSSVAFKGGWGPEGGGYLVRQSGIVSPGSSGGAAVAIVTHAPDFGTGTQTLSRAASWLKQHLIVSPRPSVGCGSE